MSDDGWFRTERGTLMKRYGPPATPVARGSFPTPMFTSDCMEPTEHLDGKHYTSKSQYRAVTKAHGMIEVGNDPARLRPKPKPMPDKQARVDAVKRAVAKAGL